MDESALVSYQYRPTVNQRQYRRHNVLGHLAVSLPHSVPIDWIFFEYKPKENSNFLGTEVYCFCDSPWRYFPRIYPTNLAGSSSRISLLSPALLELSIISTLVTREPGNHARCFNRVSAGMDHHIISHSQCK